MLDLAIAVSDRPVAPHQYTYVETHAWWLGSFGPHQHLTEQRLRLWVPAQPERDWLLDRELTGAQRWLTGSADEARSDGFDLRDIAPIGRFRAPHGNFDAALPDELFDESLEAVCAAPQPPRRGSWQSPTVDFLTTLPRDPAALLARLVEDNPGSWFGPFTAAVTALRTGIVPAELRAAFYRAVTGLPGVTFTEGAVNIDGLECLALVQDAGRTRTELMIDPDDGQFAGERDTRASTPGAGSPPARSSARRRCAPPSSTASGNSRRRDADYQVRSAVPARHAED
ncbi:hypothetical protein [Pseudonocardia nigra]|uniref:hypothetical protein n=1 Tax=Pseudonocardia nigra TaxID=1921578 RepID=UPI001C5EAE71|nr:hypothetical protein [Pseudonocardia nigra]